MPKIIFKIIPALIFWGGFAYVVLQIPYPDSLTQANLNQILPFFVSLYFALVFTFNIFLKNIFFSLSICLGLIILLALKALDALSIVTGLLTVVAIGLLASYFKKTKKKNFAQPSRIPKLHSLR